MSLTAASLVVTVYILNMHHHTTDNPPPDWLKQLLCFGTHKTNKIDKTEDVSMNGSNLSFRDMYGNRIPRPHISKASSNRNSLNKDAQFKGHDIPIRSAANSELLHILRQLLKSQMYSNTVPWPLFFTPVQC